MNILLLIKGAAKGVSALFSSAQRRCIAPTAAQQFPSAIVAHGSLADKPSRAKIHLCPLWSKSGQTRVRRNCPLRAIRRQSLVPLECPQSVVSRYLISTTGIAQHHAVAATHMDAFAEIIRSHARFSSNPDLITSRRASATFQQDRVPPCQHRRMALLERSISIQHLGARHVAAEDHAPRLHPACDDTLFKRRNED